MQDIVPASTSIREVANVRGPDAVAAGVSNERAKIIGALQSFVPVHDKDGMAVSEIMAATEATNRNAIDILLHKMRVEGQIIRVRRGVYVLPSESGKIGQKERNATTPPKIRTNLAICPIFPIFPATASSRGSHLNERNETERERALNRARS
jgi:hypothetical protein